AIEMIAAAAEAIIDGRRDPAAGRMLLRQILELRKVAAPAGARPRPDGLDRAEGRRVRVAAGAHQLEAMPAQVVVAALQQRDVHGPAKHAAEARQVPGEKLILQRARAGRDDRAAPRMQHRDEIRESLADARAGLDRDVTAAGERVGDDPGHAGLRLAVREAGQTARKDTFGVEQVRERLHRRTITRNLAAAAAPNLARGGPNPASAPPRDSTDTGRTYAGRKAQVPTRGRLWNGRVSRP